MLYWSDFHHPEKLIRMRPDRRAFFKALAFAPALANATTPTTPDRQRQAYELRQAMALFESQRPVPAQQDNGDETGLKCYIHTFSQRLPHTHIGESEPQPYQTLLPP